VKDKKDDDGKGAEQVKKREEIATKAFALGSLYLESVKDLLKRTNQSISAESLRAGKNAFKCLSFSAKEGNADAQCLMGWLYAGNDETKELTPDSGKAFEYFKQAADQGFTEAEFLVGQSYEKEIGTKQDLKLAKEYYSRAASKHHVDAQVFLGSLIKREGGEKDEEKTIPDILAAAIEARCVSMNATAAELFELGVLYEEGRRAPLRLRDLDTARNFYELAVNKAKQAGHLDPTTRDKALGALKRIKK